MARRRSRDGGSSDARDRLWSKVQERHSEFRDMTEGDAGTTDNASFLLASATSSRCCKVTSNVFWHIHQLPTWATFLLHFKLEAALARSR